MGGRDGRFFPNLFLLPRAVIESVARRVIIAESSCSLCTVRRRFPTTGTHFLCPRLSVVRSLRQHSVVAVINRVFAENLVGLGFLWSVFLYKTNPNPRKNICCEKKWPKCHFWPHFSWVGLALGWTVRRFHNIICMFFNPTQFSKARTPESISDVPIPISHR